LLKSVGAFSLYVPYNLPYNLSWHLATTLRKERWVGVCPRDIGLGAALEVAAEHCLTTLAAQNGAA